MRSIIPIVIYLVVPIVGILAYLKIYRDIERKEIPYAPYIPIFILFFAYGGWLVFILTALFWEMSGMSALGYFVLMIPAPLVMIGCITWLYQHREKSTYHTYSLGASCFYVIFVAIIWTAILLNIDKK